MTDRIQRYEEFWPFYLREHSRADTRRWHFIGTGLGLGLFALGLLFRQPLLLIAGLISGYAFAWYAHFHIEKNRPATFRYPMWSFMSDMRMFFLFVSGRLPDELNKYGIFERRP